MTRSRHVRRGQHKRNQHRHNQPRRNQYKRDQYRRKREQRRRDQYRHKQSTLDQPSRSQARRNQPSRNQPRRNQPRRSQYGVGLLASTWSVLAFFMFLFLAVQIGVNLYSTSTISALGFDASRRAASNGGTKAAIADAEAWLRDSLGPSLKVNDISWQSNNGVVRLGIDVQPPSLLIGPESSLGARRITRQFEVRTEQVVAPV